MDTGTVVIIDLKKGLYTLVFSMTEPVSLVQAAFQVLVDTVLCKITPRPYLKPYLKMFDIFEAVTETQQKHNTREALVI